MAIHARVACWCWLFATFVALLPASATQNQFILSSTPRSQPYHRFRDVNNTFSVNMTFDHIDLIKTPNQTLTSVKFLEFDRFEVINVTAANEKGLLDEGDMDCAASMPNALRSIPQRYAAPALFRSNATALNAVNVSEYFDFISFSIKPLGPAPGGMYAVIQAWEIEGGVAKDVQDIAIGWVYPGYQERYDIEPRLLFEGWGEKVNWVEVQAFTEEDEPWELCIDNVVLQFHKEGGGGEDDDGV